jgi:hypothetical protein
MAPLGSEPELLCLSDFWPNEPDKICGPGAISRIAEDLSGYKSKVAILRIKEASEGMLQARLKKL